MLEVLRGPQGTLFGKNTVAGALNITSAKPTENLEAEVKARYNIDFEETEYTGYVSGPLTDTLRGRVAFMAREMNNGWVDNQFYGENYPQTDEWAGRASLEWDMTDATLVSFKYEHGEWDNNGQPWEIRKLGPLAAAAQLAPVIAPNDPAFGQKLVGIEDDIDGKTQHGQTDPVLDLGSSQVFEGDLDEYVLTVDHQFDSATLTGILGYSEYNFGRALDADYNPLDIATFYDDEEFDQTSLELRIVSDTGDTLEYIAGLYYQDSTLFTDGLSHIGIRDVYPLLNMGCQFGAGVAQAVSCGQKGAVDALTGGGAAQGDFTALPGVARYAYLDQDTQTWAAFSQVTWNIRDDLRTTLGLRYTEEQKDVTQAVSATVYEKGNRTDLETNPLKVAAALGFLEFTPHEFDDLKRDEESFTWSLNTQWDVTQDAMVYASASTGFKAGGFNSFYMGKANGAGAFAEDVDFEEEEVLTFEVGSKMSLLDGSAELNLAYFYTQYDDLQAAIFSGNTTFEVQNAAEATTQGIELDGRWQATDNLLLSGAFGWIDFEFDSFPNQACTNAQFVAYREAQMAPVTNGDCAAAGVNDLSGRTSAFTPEFSATLSANYTQSLSDYDMDYGVDLLWRDDMYVADDLDPIMASEGVVKVNGIIRLTPHSDRWNLALIGNNLTDEDTDINWGNDMPLVGGAYEIATAPGRSFSLVATLRF
jgi:outer membrane receptor protein involved in Fe transport